MLGRTIRTLLEVRCDTEGHCLVGTLIFRFLTLKKCQALSIIEALNSASLSRCQRDMRPLDQKIWRSRAFCRVSTGDLDILLSCDMNDEPALSFCNERQPSSQSGHLGVHFTWIIKHRLPLTYIFLRENSSWSSCEKLGYHFNRTQGISFHLETIWGARSIHPGALLKLMFL